VLGAEAQSPAVARANHQREGQLTVGHVARLGDLVDDDVPADGEEVGEHDLGNGTQPGHRRAHGRAQDCLLADRSVAHANPAELL
jgi:hypothetical protein